MKLLLKAIFLISFVFCSTFVFAEEITITTYYPSPYGSYKNLNIYNQDEDTAQTDFTQAVTKAGLLITTDYTANAYTPGLFWSTNNNNPTRPKAGIYLRETATGTNMYLGTSDNYAAGITNNAMVIDPSGNVGIGVAAPTFQLQLSTDSACKPATSAWTIASDKRIKKNISDFTDGLNIVMKLKPRIYQYNGFGGKGYNDTNTHIGFVAQEVEPIAPYMIETGKGTIGGAQVSDFKNYQGHALPFILLNAIQEQQNIIKAQQLQIDGLNARLGKLEEKQTRRK